jgi:hypothetical protein
MKPARSTGERCACTLVVAGVTVVWGGVVWLAMASVLG